MKYVIFLLFFPYPNQLTLWKTWPGLIMSGRALCRPAASPCAAPQRAAPARGPAAGAAALLQWGATALAAGGHWESATWWIISRLIISPVIPVG